MYDGGGSMEKDFYRIQIYGYPFLIIGDEKCSKYKVFYETIYHDEHGRSFSKIKKIKTYNSVGDMESDFNGFLDFIEYEEEERINDGNGYEEFESTAPNDKGRLDR